ncbi:MAG: hypothetical protein HZA90_00080 [Verrucomicrobia bacterium]|nr:hypothetical protein [Verrucomicrobiota bacterium]
MTRLLASAFVSGALAIGLHVASAATNQLRPWTDYRTVMWVGDSVWKQPAKLPLFLQRLREMGINTTMVSGDANPQPFLEHQFPYYVENVVNRGLCLKWNSKVHDWDKFVTDWTKGGRPESAFVRDYCLDDPQWRSWARDQMQRAARQHAPHSPLAYDIRDELSTTISANPFDYDFNPITLAKFREWLKTQYRPKSERPLTPSLSHPMGEGARRAGEGSDAAALATLNAQWETKFASWDDVKPFTTDQIKHRMASGEALPRGKPDWLALQRLKFDPAEARKQPTRWNLSPWCDFRTYMDISLAGALDDIRQASHAVDPRTPVGIEGTQMPSAWGGYDLWRLSQVLDWVEPYDIGNARDIFGSFMPGKPIVTTVFEKDTDHACRRLWHLLLEGDRGCIIWWSEDCIDWKSPDYALTPKAKALAPVLKEMTSPLGQLFLRAEKEHDPIAIHYSQPSIQVAWLIESTADGSTWHRRFSSFEADHNRHAKVRNAWLKAFQDLGFNPRFVAADQISEGELRQERVRIVVLPQSLALAAVEAEQTRSVMFAKTPGSVPPEVFCDGSPGLFDEHGKLRPRSRLEDLFPPSRSAATSYVNSARWKTRSLNADITTYARERLKAEPKSEWLEWISAHLSLTPPVALRATNLQSAISNLQSSFPRTRIHRYKLGSARLLAFERNIDYHMSEDLKQAGGNEALEKPIDLEATFVDAAHVYDLRVGKYLGHTTRLAFRLDPWQPSLFALLSEKVAEDRVMESLLALSVGK